eukprot:6213455-Pleurochrysis_carterae.AAC.4
MIFDHLRCNLCASGSIQNDLKVKSDAGLLSSTLRQEYQIYMIKHAVGGKRPRSFRRWSLVCIKQAKIFNAAMQKQKAAAEAVTMANRWVTAEPEAATRQRQRLEYE